MSKSLIKLLDNALLPAALMLVSKFIGILLSIQIFNISWVVQQTPNNIFSFQTVLSSQDAITVTSYSDMLMFCVLALGFTINILRAVFLHKSHVSLDLLTRLAHKNLLNLIKSSYEIYHSAFIWLVFMWIAALMILNNTFSQAIFPWVGIVALLTSTLLTVIFFQDVYKELEYLRQHPGKYLNKYS